MGDDANNRDHLVIYHHRHTILTSRAWINIELKKRARKAAEVERKAQEKQQKAATKRQ
jgi:hypothetical protein